MLSKTHGSLLQKAIEGDATAQTRLFEEYKPFVQSVLLSIGVYDEHDRDDRVQETMIQVFRSIDSFEWRGCGSFRGWVSHIARNTVNAVRRTLRNKFESSHRILSHLDELEKNIVDNSSDASKVFQRHLWLLLAKSTWEVIKGQVSENESAVFQLILVEQKSIGEAAQFLRKDPRTVTTTLAKVTRKLRKAIQSDYGFGDFDPC